ncbi:DUF2207 domain-containing protein [Companilactobacillus sp.]|uniref:DUF2207 domain-containing protein n=1 Tax=Companilactobacillus sp. TaxID=2767905 RepID=UPI002605948A|nr:DUF2207 domain-containing protein [Companilactobacillus sp.]
MKKIKLLLVSFFAAFIGFMMFSNVASADDSYEITNYQMDVNVLKNGDANVTQKITYDFDGDFHGVYYNMDTNGIKGMSNLNVSVTQDGDNTPVLPANDESNNSYTLTNDGKIKKIKVYHAVYDTHATFIYRYKLHGVVTNYQDTAELNWKVIGSGWDQEINHANIQIKLPEDNIKQLRAWAHGPLDGYNKVDHENGRVTMTVDNLPENQFVETHMIFPVKVTATNKNVVHEKKKASIIKQEKKLADEANHQRAVNKMKVYAIIPIFIIIVLVIYLVIFIKWRKNPDTKIIKPIPIHHWFEIPNMKPSMARLIVKKAAKADYQGLTGDMMYEVFEKNLKILPDGKTYQIEKSSDSLNPFFKFLIDKIGDGTKVSIKQIKKTKSEDLNYQFNLWQDRHDDDRKKYFSEQNESLVKSVNWSMYLTIIISVLFVLLMSILMSSMFIPSLIIGLIVIAFSAGLKVYVDHNVSIYTQLGADTANELQGFRRMLRDVNDIKVAEVGDLILWEQILPYAAAFGVSKKVIDALKVSFGAEVMTVPLIGYYYYGLGSLDSNNNFGSAINSSYEAFERSVNSSSSSSSGFGSGGFSGGSSGGFGGGSGGGAF